MTEGCFYFINDQYFVDFADPYLMKNKETVNGVRHGRPCNYVFKDQVNGLFWMVPISSQVEKFKAIYSRKTENGKKCDTIVFGEILGRERVFLIQNMCPVTAKYIDTEYIDSKNNIPVRVSYTLEQELNKKAKRTLMLYRKGIKVIFPNVSEIERRLLADLT